ncbi:murein biosynthesis integral membrane protein MurJ, partial [Anaerotalea alkaliphila]
PAIKKLNFKYLFRINFRDEKIKKTLQIAIPVIIGTSVNQINKLVDRTIASSLAIGGISALNYASRLNLFIQGLFVTSIITVMYPLISSYASKNKIDEIKRVLLEYINIVIIILLPITIGTVIFNREIIELLFGRGLFDDVAVQMTSTALLFYSIGMLGFGLREVLARGFYSIQDTKTPMVNAAIGMIVNIILNILLSKILGIGGLALATSISAMFTTILLFISLRKKIGSFGIKQIGVTFFKTLIGASVMGLITKVSYIYLINSLSQNISLLISITTGAISYLLIMLFMRIKEVDSITEVIKMKSRNIVYKNRR